MRHAGRRFIGCLLAIAAACVAAPQARSQPAGFPAQPLRIIVPFAPGGAPDIVARLLAEHAAPQLGQPVTVENRTGAGGNIGMQAGARAAPDGHTILMCTLGCTTNAFLMQNLGWDPGKDIRPVMMGGIVPNVLVVGEHVPARNVAEFLALARAQPGRLTMASSGTGSASHLAGEMFKAMADVRIEHVPYRGSTVALPDIIAGRVDSMIVSLPEALGSIQGGRLRALGVSSRARSPALPEVPTIEQAGVPGYGAVAWSALVVPAATPDAVVARLNAVFNAALAAPPVRARFAELSIQPVGGAPEELNRFMAAETEAWGRLIRERGITAN
ncbi:Bug family tripartite tricarboxylate transporter substrate binding protein [Falsiroseomonas oryzae]|uniref:Bug family tripartite tricarboxylate transporter substrate binding protein n=1 Tax=Falsiroseomonas oryzae TaxID=2766473 RepID=UPI0022EA1034|nr:tripartite tricarboxylate transporter substrate binding protein [Roseomonas sp. MO-31]